jgi:hypothetical protein
MPSLEAMPAAAAPNAETVASHAEATATSEATPAEALVAEAPAAAALAATEARIESANVIAEASDVTAAATAPEAVSAMEAPAEIAAMTSEAADAHDEAVLDMIAAEMSAPDDSDDDFGSEPAEMQLDDGPPAEPEMIASSTIASSEVSAVPALAPVEPSAPKAIIEPAPEPSLGSTLIANGFLRKSVSASDPLAALRRLSQIEKIALFS